MVDIYINTDISNETRVYSNFAAAKAAFGHPVAIAHETENGKVKLSYVAFEKNNKIYYLKGRINEANKPEKPVYNKNVETLKEAIGSNWQSLCSEGGNIFTCTDSGVTYEIKKSGTVNVWSGSSWNCTVDNSGFSRCTK